MLGDLLDAWIPSLLLQLIGEAVEDEALRTAAIDDHMEQKRVSIVDDGLTTFLRVGGHEIALTAMLRVDDLFEGWWS